jgi:DNA-binding transcriptional LysR family regulator
VDWDDLRYVLAVARAGSALRAAEQLGVNQTTVIRRLQALECALGSCLFERRRSGHTPTDIGRLAVETAERMEQEAMAFSRALSARQRTLTGSIRFTTSETLALRLVTPCLGAFRKLHPAVSIELIVADERLDIARGDADMALRAGSRPEGAGIVARRLPDNAWTVYCSHAYAAEHGFPDGPEAIRGHDIIGMEGHMAQVAGWVWLRARAPDAVIRFRSNSLINLVANLKAGLGLGALPTLIGDTEPELMRCFPPPPELTAEIWLIVREELKGQPHVRAFTEFLAEDLRKVLATFA